MSRPQLVSSPQLVLYGWMYFRITNFDQLIAYNHALLSKWDGWAPALSFLAQGSLFLLLWIMVDAMELFWLKVHDQDVRRTFGISIYIALMILLVLVLHAEDPSSFIYFRF